MTKIMLAGIGGYGKGYVKELTEKEASLPSVSIAGVCEVMPDVYERFPILKEKGIPVFSSPEEFFRKEHCDLAVLSTPIHLHYPQIRTCLEAGANVLTEKPVCTSVEDAEDLIRISERTGHFISVGYQLNYSKDVLKLKEDILNGVFGKPVSMKTLHCMKRGMKYYGRNNWAGKITVNGVRVNDSPVNNACAHQLQNMTFLLGKTMDDAVDFKDVKAELYRANPHVENFDTAAILAHTADGTEIRYYTTHALSDDNIGPVSEYRFEKGTVWYGMDFGEGPVNDYVASMNDGSVINYAGISKGERLQKLYDAIACTENGGHPVCTVRCAIPHLELVNQLSEFSVRPVDPGQVECVKTEEDTFYYIRSLHEIFAKCFEQGKFPSEIGAQW
jgi:predicted dehydrogenase